MSQFGAPGGGRSFSKPTPPERGSFPLDHDGECKQQMMRYLRCIKSHRGTNDDVCRLLSREYLECRMERNLMARDTPENLGFADIDAKTAAARAAAASEGTATTSKASIGEPKPGGTKS